MHNIKNIRENFEAFKNKIKLRNIDVDIEELLKLDKHNRDLIYEKENLEKERKEISKKMTNHYLKNLKK